jgi:hypothetical protein
VRGPRRRSRGGAAGRRWFRRSGQGRITALDEFDEAPFELSTRKEHVAPAAEAAKADVGTEPIDQPCVRAARMAPAKPDDVAQEQRENGRVRHLGG